MDLIRLEVKYNTGLVFERIMQEHLEKNSIKYSHISIGEVEVDDKTNEEEINAIKLDLEPYSIEFLTDSREILV